MPHLCEFKDDGDPEVTPVNSRFHAINLDYELALELKISTQVYILVKLWRDHIATKESFKDYNNNNKLVITLRMNHLLLETTFYDIRGGLRV